MKHLNKTTVFCQRVEHKRIRFSTVSPAFLTQYRYVIGYVPMCRFLIMYDWLKLFLG